MPPKRKGRPPKTAGESLDNESETAGAFGSKNPPTRRGREAKGKGKALVPDVYKEMLAHAHLEQPDTSEPPLKRRRAGVRGAPRIAGNSNIADQDTAADDDEDIAFEDVLGTEMLAGSNTGENGLPLRQQQTAYRDTDEGSSDEGSDWDEVDFGALPKDDGPSGDLELTLTTRTSPTSAKKAVRRRAVNKEERGTRLELHRMHVLCLLSYVDRRNKWCNDLEVQKSLKKLVDKKWLADLHPKENLSQFGKTEFFKRGLDKVGRMWQSKWEITAKGIRRALWAEEDVDLTNYKLSDDVELLLSKSDFKLAAKNLEGSRDLGAQLYCALLRSAGLDARLVCSLQPLSFNTGGPSMPKSFVQSQKRPSQDVVTERPTASTASPAEFSHAYGIPFGSHAASVPGMYSSPRRRLGHPNATDYQIPEFVAHPRPPPKLKQRKNIVESPFPVFWVEVLDEAHQKWFAVDPLVTETIAKPQKFEPPMSDRENSMSYVIAFEDGGNARDVTKRYAKAYNAKTRRNRVEFTHGGEKWFKKTMRAYYRGWKSDLDQIEDIELTTLEAREPMPKNIADFKDHPVYALERHFKRNELLVAAQAIGKIPAGRDSGAPGGRKMENVYRRRDVKIARSADAWYRLGRDLKMAEQPVKTVPAKRKPDEALIDDEPDERPGTNLYTKDQTELYEAPPVINGRVPKNTYGNIDVYCPSMVPPGGIHLPYEDASRAARLLGIDYAEALTGFDFRGRHGTAVFKGVVVATEFQEAVEAVIAGFRDEEAREREQKRELAVLKMWKRFLFGLRIKARVDAYASDGEENAHSHQTASDNDDYNENENDDDDSDDGMDDANDFGNASASDEGGGFLLE